MHTLCPSDKGRIHPKFDLSYNTLLVKYVVIHTVIQWETLINTTKCKVK